MSYTKIDNSIFEDENLKHTEFRVLTYLIRNYNTSKGYAYPTRKQIIESCNINKDTLSNVLNSLEEKGYITRKINPFKAGRNNIYYIHKYIIDNAKEEKEVEVVVEETPVEELNIAEINTFENEEEEDLRQKVESVECTIGKKIKQSFKNILKKLSWDELIKIDMNMCGKDVNESYYIKAIHDIRPDLRCFV